MSGESGYFKLGLFVMVGIALLVAGIVVLGAGALFTDYITVETAMQGSVEGLDVGSAVKYMGIKVGKVSNIEMAMWRYESADPALTSTLQKYVIVEMKIRRNLLLAKSSEELQRNFSAAVERGLRARQASSGLTGPSFVEILFVDPATHAATPLAWTPREMYIPNTPTEMTEIVSGVQSLMDKLKKTDIPGTVDKLKVLLDHTDAAVQNLQMKDLRQRVGQVLDEVQGSTKRLRGIIESDQVTQTVDNLPRISARASDTLARVDEIVHDPKVQKTLDNLNAAVASAQPATVELSRILKRLDQLMASENQDFEAIVVNLRRILDQAAALMEDAKNNPSRVVFGEPPPRNNGEHK